MKYLMFDEWAEIKRKERDYCVLYKRFCFPYKSVRGCVSCYERYVMKGGYDGGEQEG